MGVSLPWSGSVSDQGAFESAATPAPTRNIGTIGAGMNRLQSAVAVLQTQVQNTQSAESTIRDANMAEEISNLTKQQILAQSGMAALAQANAGSQNVLSLLK